MTLNYDWTIEAGDTLMKVVDGIRVPVTFDEEFKAALVWAGETWWMFVDQSGQEWWLEQQPLADAE